MNFSVELQSGQRLPVDERRPLLEQLAAQHISVRHSCRNGNCGLCDTALLGGKVRIAGQARSGGAIPLCTACPASDLQLGPLPRPAATATLSCQRLDSREHRDGSLRLRLPAGRQPAIAAGDRVTVAGIGRARVLERQGRELRLSLSANSEQSLLTLHWRETPKR